jgi:hypothetical protein
MKKQYMTPETIVVKIHTQNILALSAQGLDGLDGYGGSATSGSADASSYRNSLWGDE